MTNFALSPTGKRTVVEARGAVFTIPAKKGDVRNLTNSSGSAERDPAWSPDSKWVAYASRVKSLYGAIWVTKVDTGDTRQVTAGLADAMCPVFDASGERRDGAAV